MSIAFPLPEAVIAFPYFLSFPPSEKGGPKHEILTGQTHYTAEYDDKQFRITASNKRPGSQTTDQQAKASETVDLLKRKCYLGWDAIPRPDQHFHALC
jgi:hypothetical protein